MRCRRLMILLGWLAAPARGSCGDFTRIVVGDVDTATDAFAIDLDGDGSVDVVSASQYDRESIISKVFWHQNDGSMSPGFSEPNLIAGSGSSRFDDVFAIDVDGDGDVDALSASALDTVAWYENDGSQLFTEHVITDSAGTAHSVYAIDVDGDGDVDPLSASVTDDTVAWYENDGSQGFTKRVITALANGACSVYAIDVDGDGDVDALSASKYDDTVAWYENDGSQSFTERVITTLADAATISVFAYAIDLDGDGDVDALSASYEDDTVAWYENDGSQSFTKHIIETLADKATSVFAIDVDSDGDVDALSAWNNMVSWYENDGSEAFATHGITTDASYVQSVYAADVDGDGDMDVLSADYNAHVVAWYDHGCDGCSDGVVSFTETVISNTADGADSVFAIDVDGDGDVDVLSGSREDDTVAWYDNFWSSFGFSSARTFTTSVLSSKADGVATVFAIDVDGDGDVDVLSASYEDDTVAWYENDGSQSFTEHVITDTVDYAIFVFAIDADGDGDVDVLSASYIDDTVAWYENDGSQSFTERIISDTADEATFVFAIDVDGDGDVDVLAPDESTSVSDDTIEWFENDGSQSFTDHIVADAADFASSVFAIDVDGDGDVDVLSASMNDDTVAWHENDGSQSFTERIISSTADGVSSIFAIDVDGDGDVDVLSASVYDDTVAWYENDGSQSFTERVITDAADSARSVFAIDVDGDGDVDALSASFNDDTVAWYENDGSQSFAERVITTLADAALGVFAIDLDGDGDVDVLSASVYDDTVAWYENDGSQSFTQRVITTLANGAICVFAIDVDGDGDVDVLSASIDDDTVAWYENDCAAHAPTPRPTNNCASVSFAERIITTLAGEANSVFAIDVDGDGDVDALSAVHQDDTVAWYENDGSQSFTQRVITNSADEAHSVFAIDVDGDGDVDALSASYIDDTVAWYENDGSQSFTLCIITNLADNALSVFAIDVDGDGDVDVLSASAQDDTVSWYENDGSRLSTERIISSTAYDVFSVFAIDVDGDGDVDALSASATDNTVAWYENDGSQSFTERVVGTPNNPRAVFAIDVDGDGDVDALSASVYDHVVAWYENDASQSFTQRVIADSADSARSVYAIDVDGDGDVDALSASHTDDTIAWYENDGSESFTKRVITDSANAARSVYAIDVDGDGDIDALSASENDDTVAWYENDCGDADDPDAPANPSANPSASPSALPRPEPSPAPSFAPAPAPSRAPSPAPVSSTSEPTPAPATAAPTLGPCDGVEGLPAPPALAGAAFSSSGATLTAGFAPRRRDAASRRTTRRARSRRRSTSPSPRGRRLRADERRLRRRRGLRRPRLGPLRGGALDDGGDKRGDAAAVADAVGAASLVGAVAGEDAIEAASKNVAVAARRLSRNATGNRDVAVSGSTVTLPDAVAGAGATVDVVAAKIDVGDDDVADEVHLHVLGRGGAATAAPSSAEPSPAPIALEPSPAPTSPAPTAPTPSSAAITVRIAYNATFGPAIVDAANATCPCGFLGAVNHTCPDGRVVAAACDGSPSVVTLGCGGTEAACVALRGGAWVDDACAWVDGACACRMSLDAPYDFGARAADAEDALAYAAVFAAPVDARRSRVMLVALAALFAACVVAAALTDVYARLVPPVRSRSHSAAGLDVDQRSYMHGQRHRHIFEQRKPLDALFRALERSHPLVNIVCVRGEVVSRRARILKLGCELLFFAAGIALGNSLEFPDPGCDGFRTERACLDRQTPFHARRDACVWDACGRSCAFHEPDVDDVSSVASTVCLAIALGLLVPVIQAFGVLFDRYLAAPYPAALRWHCCGDAPPERPEGARRRRFEVPGDAVVARRRVGGTSENAYGIASTLAIFWVSLTRGRRAARDRLCDRAEIDGEAARVGPAVADAVVARCGELDAAIAAAADPALAAQLVDLRRALRRRWRWRDDRAAFVLEATKVVRAHIELAAAWDDDLAALVGKTDEDTVALRAAKLYEFERVAAWARPEQLIYDRSIQRNADDDEASKLPPSLGAYLVAWVAAAALVAAAAYYLASYASGVGNPATRLFLLELCLTFVLFYGVIETLFVAFFSVLLPGLLKEHYAQFADPTAIRRFPFETRLPSLSTFFVASWHDELRHTAIGRHCLGEARLEERGAAAAPVAGALADEGWRPSLPTEVAIFLISFVIVLPSELQQALFEELVLFVWGAATAIAIALEPRIGVIPRLVLVLLSLFFVFVALRVAFVVGLKSFATASARLAKPAAAPAPAKAAPVDARRSPFSKARLSAFSPRGSARGAAVEMSKRQKRSSVAGRTARQHEGRAHFDDADAGAGPDKDVV
ncbi:hypothetical protein JL721_259 [Aureococcus anophagefferens]|nr:hypothetical protein JL721_259 [Aureococcus anophagefferens]